MAGYKMTGFTMAAEEASAGSIRADYMTAQDDTSDAQVETDYTMKADAVLAALMAGGCMMVLAGKLPRLTDSATGR